MMIGEAMTHNTQLEACTGALSVPVSASVAHLNVKGTASVAILAANNSTTDQTTRIFRSARSPGQMYGHRCASVPARVACPIGVSGDGAGWAGALESSCAIEPHPVRCSGPIRPALFQISSHSAVI